MPSLVNIAALKEKRLASGKTLEKISKETGLSERTIYSYEADERTPRLDALYKLAQSYNCDVQDLLNTVNKENIKFSLNDIKGAKAILEQCKNNPQLAQREEQIERLINKFNDALAEHE